MKGLEEMINSLYSTDLGINRPELIEVLEQAIRANWPTERGYSEEDLRAAFTFWLLDEDGNELMESEAEFQLFLQSLKPEGGGHEDHDCGEDTCVCYHDNWQSNNPEPEGEND